MDADLPTFSVVVPLYNKRDYVRQTVESVLAQSLQPLEVIVIDDGSTDGSAAAIADLAGDRLRIVRQANAGVSAARNRGVAEARGRWIALVDADDLWLESHLATLDELARRFSQADLVASSFRRVSPDAACAALLARPAPSRPGLFDLFTDRRDDVLSASSVAIRREAFLAAGGFGNLRVGEDTEFWVRFALDHVFACDPRGTTLYRAVTGGTMDQEETHKSLGGADHLPAVFATIDAALATPRFADRRDAIHGYADRIRTTYARSLLYHGRGRAVRGMCAGLHRRSAETRAYVALSLLPPSLLRGAARAYSLLKRR